MICSKCGGTGKVETVGFGLLKCLACGGTGKIRRMKKKVEQGTPTTIEKWKTDPFRRIDPKDYVHMLKEIREVSALKGKFWSIIKEIIWAHTTYIGHDGRETRLNDAIDKE